jgi:AAA family ATP:ADP antiporter
MQSLFERTNKLQPGERLRVLVMASYIFVIIMSYNVLKPMTRSLFVMNQGLGQLPGMYMLVALVVGIFVFFYLRLANKLKLNRLINVTNLFLTSNLLLFWWLLYMEFVSPVLYYGLFVWVSIFGVLTTGQYWLLATYLFNAREAKRIFPLLTTSAILGAIAGGYFTGFLVKTVGTANLAFFCIALLLLAGVLANMGWRHRQPGSATRKKYDHATDASGDVVREVVAIIRKSRHLSLLVAMIALTFMVVEMADFQFLAYARENNNATDDLTGFIGLWLSNMSVIALLFQLLFAGAIVSRFGVGATIIFLPVALLIASAWVFMQFSLVSILGLKIGDGAFRHSINKMGLELLYLPIPEEIKRKAKSFIDMFVDRFARGFAGFLLLCFYSWLGFSVQQISLVSIALITVWLVICWLIYQEYVNSFRTAIAKRQIDANTINISIQDDQTIQTLINNLNSPNVRQIVYALQLLESVQSIELTPHLIPLLRHPSEEVRLGTLRLLDEERDGGLNDLIEPLLRDPSEHVRREAVRYCARAMGSEADKQLQAWLQSEDQYLRGATLYYLAGKPTLAHNILTPDHIRKFMHEDEISRAYAADALGLLTDSQYHPLLAELLDAAEPAVKLRAIASAGAIQADQFVPQLVKDLADRRYRKAARQALADYGGNVAADLARLMADKNLPLHIRTKIPRVLGLIAEQASVDRLFDELETEDETLRYPVIKALSRLRLYQADLKFDDRLDTALDEELKKYYRILSALRVAPGSNDADSQSSKKLLRRALRERLDDHIDRIFRLLALRYPPKDIYNAYVAMNGRNPADRANAIEFLDNILSQEHKSILLPIVERLSPEQILRQANNQWDVRFDSQEAALRNILAGSDVWLRVCAIYAIGHEGMPDTFERTIDEARLSDIPIIRETANLVWR